MMATSMKGRDDRGRLCAGQRAASAMLALLVSASLSSASDKYEAGNSEYSESSSGTASGAKPVPSTRSVPKGGLLPESSPESLRPSSSISGVTDPNRDEKLLLDLINVERASRKLRPLRWDGMLSGLARTHAVDMRAIRKATHNSPRDGADFRTRLARTPYRSSAAAENVAFNADVAKAHRALMASPGHRRNILDPGLTAIGLGVVVDSRDDWVWVVEDFATPIAHVTDEEAAAILRDALLAKRKRWASIPEDKAMSRRLRQMVEEMVEDGTVRHAIGGGVGVGWTLAFTSLDPTQPPDSALERIAKADGYALAVTFRKTPRYPFGAYWAILYLKGVY